MRNRYIVSYDISEPKRLRKTFKTMRGYGDPVQYSVFVCTLSKEECVILKTTLDSIIDHDNDRVMIVNIGPVGGQIEKTIDFMGKMVEFPEQKVVVV